MVEDLCAALTEARRASMIADLFAALIEAMFGDMLEAVFEYEEALYSLRSLISALFYIEFDLSRFFLKLLKISL